MNMRGLSCRPLDSCEEMVAERRAEYYTTYLGNKVRMKKGAMPGSRPFAP